jgi:hypothetical protein
MGQSGDSLVETSESLYPHKFSVLSPAAKPALVRPPRDVPSSTVSAREKVQVKVDPRLREVVALEDELVAAEKDERERSVDASLRRFLYSEGENARLQETVDQLRLQLASSSLASSGTARPFVRARDPAAEAESSAVATLRLRVQQLERATAEAVAGHGDAEEETASLRATVASQASQIRALMVDVSTSLQRDARDTVRLERAEAEAAASKAELAKRLGQVHKLVEALNRVKEREAGMAAGMEAQAASLASLQTALLRTTAESERWAGAVSVLEAQHAATGERCEALREAAEAAAARRADEEEAVAAAVESARAVTALSAALSEAGEEAARLSAVHGEEKEVARAAASALTKRCDEQAELIQALQGDLAAAIAAVAGGLGAGTLSSSAWGPPSAAGGGVAGRRSRGGGGGVLQALLEGDGSEAFEPAFPSVHPASVVATVGAGGGPAEMARLRLACESLARRLRSREERLQSAESERDDLVEVNERLRHALEASMDAGADVPAGGQEGTSGGALERALGHADSLLKRKMGADRALPTGGSGASPARRLGGAEDADPATLSALRTRAASSELALRLLLAHAVRSEAVAGAAAHLLRETRGLVYTVRAGLEEEAGGPGSFSGHTGAATEDALLAAQLARLPSPVGEALAGPQREWADLASRSTEGEEAAEVLRRATSDPSAFVDGVLQRLRGGQALRLPQQLTDATLLRALLADGAGAVATVSAGLAERSAVRLGGECAQQ